MADTKTSDLTATTSPVDTDVQPIVTDMTTVPVTKKITWSNIKAALKTYFDTLYMYASGVHAATSKTAPVDADEIPLLDSAGSYGLNRLLLSNLKKHTSLNETITVLTSGSGTFTPRAGTVMMDAELVGGGGAGGGCTAATGTCGIGSGGGAGGYVRKLYTSIAGSYSYGVGAGGTGVSNATGNNGGNTTFGALTASGGTGGTVLADNSTLVGIVGQAGGTATGGDVNVAGGAGGGGTRLSGSTGLSGQGGNAVLGAGGAGRVTNGAGNSGTAYGGGGAGAFQQNTAGARLGGSGADGVIIIREYGI